MLKLPPCNSASAIRPPRNSVFATGLSATYFSHAGCRMWDCGMLTFQICSPAIFLPQLFLLQFFNRQIFAAFSTIVDLFFGAHPIDICGSVIALATFIADLSWTVRSSSIDSIPIIHSLQNLLMAKNLHTALIDQRID